jgi:hypothetical protein
MSPASYLAAPPRVAGGQYTSVDAIFWAALGLFVAGIVFGAAFVGVRGWRAWQACVSLALVGTAGADLLLERAAKSEARAERVNARVEELVQALARLERSRARSLVLVGAVGEMLDVVRAVVAFVPKK